MPIPLGTRFGPYQVNSQLGEGGMGEVYRAHDTRLGRDVALKVLHSDVAQNAERRARFEREARAVAGLNHPNIVAIFDIGEDNGVFYFVSELVEGELLRDRIERGALPVRELLDIAVQMADGISAAHTAGITHRDLKPENVMLTRDGRVKILDFGLARQAAAPSPTQDRTVTINETQPGTVLGTANYMSPEQVRGQAVDYRSDQFSFGVILYEMATGKQAFHRESAILTMSAVVTDEPPVMDQAVQSKLPPPLRWTMNRCLAKDPSRRYESTRDLCEDLRAQREHLHESYSSGSLPPLPEVRKGGSSSVAWKAAAAALLVVSAGLAIALIRNGGAADSMMHDHFTPFAVSSEPQSNPVWSRDGKAAAYRGVVDGHGQLFVRYLNSPVPVQLTTAGGIGSIFRWSPDSRRIFFSAINPNKGGPSGAVFSIAAVGGDPQLLMAVDSITEDVSPDGSALAVYKPDTDGRNKMFISSPIGSPLKPYPSAKFANQSIMNAPTMRFSPDGKKLLLLLNDGTRERRWLLPYAGSQEPREVLASLPQGGFTPTFSWFPDSRHIVFSHAMHTSDPTDLWMADTAGSGMRRLTSIPSTNQVNPTVSPDGKRILYQEIGSDYDIAKVSLTDGKVMRLIATGRRESMPAWAAKTGKFAYVTDRDGPYEVWMQDESGSNRPLVTPADFAPTQVNLFMNPTLTPDADRVIYTMGEVGAKSLLYISSTSGGPPTRVTDSTGSGEFAGSLSPDGKQLVYVEIGGIQRIMIVKTSGEATPTVLRENTANGLPQWSPAGEWITFGDANGWHLISPDGKTVRDLGIRNEYFLTFSRDGKKLFGMRSEGDHKVLYSLDVNGDKGSMKTIAEIGRDYTPRTNLNPGYRLSVAPDGTCGIYTIGASKSSIWLFEGFTGPK